MSTTTGGIVGGVIGGVIGFFATGGNPIGALKGAAIGNAIGGAVDPPKIRTEGPRLQDKRVAGAEYGYGIPKVYGTSPKLGGWLMWSDDLEEVATTTTSGGKGGPTTESTQYDTYFTGAFLLCEGPVVTIRRIWADGKILYDGSASNTGMTGGEFSQLEAFYQNLKFGTTSPARFDIYLGTETQLPNATMEQKLGVGNVPAYRGMAYVVISSMLLTPYGKRIPIFEFEVVTAGSVLDQVSASFNLDRFIPNPGAALLPPPPRMNYSATINAVISGLYATSGTPQGIQLQAITPGSGLTRWSVSALSDYVFYTQWAIDDAKGILWRGDQEKVYAHNLATGIQILGIAVGAIGGTFSGGGMCLHRGTGNVWYCDQTTIYVLDSAAILAGATAPQATLYTITLEVSANALYYIPIRQWVATTNNTAPNNVVTFFDRDGSVVRSFDVGFQPSEIFGDPNNDYAWLSQGNNLRRLDLDSGALLLQTGTGANTPVAFDANSAGVFYYHQTDKTVRLIDASLTVKRTIDVSTQVDAAGTVKGLTWVPSTGELFVQCGELQQQRYTLDRIQSNLVQLDDIVIDVCLTAGVPANKIDVTALTDTINGYIRDGRMQARDAIEPLRKVGFFDLIHSNNQIKAVKRGGAPVKTISYEELVMGDDGALPLGVSIREDQDVASTIEVLYNDPAINNEINRQSAVRPSQITGDIVEEPIPVSMPAATARRIAEVMLYSGAFQRNTISLPLSRKHIDLEDSDALTFIWPDATTSRMIVAKHDYQFPLNYRIDAFEEDGSAFTNTAIGVDAGWIPPTPTFAGALSVQLLDIPILSDTHDYEGAYVVISADGLQTGTAGLFESVDNGVTYRSVGTFALLTSGYASTALANYTGLAWDETSTVRVTIGSGTLESYTDIQVLNGRGAALLGNEVIQWRNATLVSAGTYDLTRLLRGRRGTEWAIGTHTAGERFIPLTDAIQRIAQTALGQARLYKAGLVGSDIAAASPISFTNTQIGKKPFSPVYIAGTRDGSLNLTGTFMRRSRIGSGWGTNVEIPLGEDLEKYEIDIMSGSTVKRTIKVTAETFSYTAAEQTTDFGSTQSSILVNVYQMSLIAGRGTVGVATI